MGAVLLRLQAQAADPSRPEFNWVKRRVECMEFLDTRAVRRHISVDFEVPSDAPCILVGEQQFRLVPITNLPKGSMVAFDIKDENDRALWLPTSDYSGNILASTIAYWAEDILGTDFLADDLNRIVKGPAELGKEWELFGAAAALIDAASRHGDARDNLTKISDWLRAFRSLSLRERLTLPGLRQWSNLQRQWASAQDRLNAAAEDLRRAGHDWTNIAPESPAKKSAVMTLMEGEDFRSQLEELARNLVVLAAVTSPPKTRRVVKLTFESPITYRTPRGLPLRLIQSAGWRCWRVDVPIGGRGGIHHLEAASPPGVDIVQIRVTPGVAGRQVRQRGGTPHVHVRVPGDTPYRSRARILLRVSRPGWLTISWLVALVIGAVMVAGRLKLSVLFSVSPGQPPGSEAASAATLLLALLGVVAAVLARPGEHPLASRLLLLARMLILIDAGVVLSATGALALHSPQTSVNATLWNCLLVIALVVALLVTISRTLPVMSVRGGIGRLVVMLSIMRR
jgi:hypothetical protein